MRQSKTLLTLTLAIYVLYSLQGVLYRSGSVLSQVLLLIFLLIGVYGLFSSFSQPKRNPRFVNIWAIFFILLTITFIVSPMVVYGTVNEAMGQMSTFGQYKNIIFVCLSFFAVHCFAKRGATTDKYMFYVSAAMIVVAVLRYIYAMRLLQQEYMDDFQNNAAYNIVVVIPFLPYIFNKQKLIATLLAIGSIALILYAAKRGAIVCLIVSILTTIIYLLRRSRMASFKQVLIIALAVGIGALMFHLTMQNEFLLDRIEETQDGNIGTREIAYSMLWNNWLKEDIFTQIFGSGLLQSVNVWGNSAHNDWLELLTDNGLLGVLIYLLFFIYLFKYINKMTGNNLLQLSILLATVILLTKSMFSMGYVDFNNVPIIMTMGLCAGLYESNLFSVRR